MESLHGLKTAHRHDERQGAFFDATAFGLRRFSTAFPSLFHRRKN
jgi:hypothetical protein